MNTLPCFLLFAFFAVFGAGCTASSASTSHHHMRAVASTATSAPGYHLLSEDQFFARYQRGEVTLNVRAKYRCVPSGHFNIAPDNSYLTMHVQCKELHPLSNRAARSVTKEVKIPLSGDSSDVFQIPFKDAAITVEHKNSVLEVRFHYSDKYDEYRHIRLHQREKDEEYAYSIAGIAGDDAAPLGRTVMLRVK